jgi:hypothetical protein
MLIWLNPIRKMPRTQMKTGARICDHRGPDPPGVVVTRADPGVAVATPASPFRGPTELPVVIARP